MSTTHFNMMTFMIVSTPKICSIFDMKWHKEHLQTSLKNITHLTYSTNITPLFQSLQNYFNSSSLHDCKRQLKAEKNREKFWRLRIMKFPGRCQKTVEQNGCYLHYLQTNVLILAVTIITFQILCFLAFSHLLCQHREFQAEPFIQVDCSHFLVHVYGYLILINYSVIASPFFH